MPSTQTATTPSTIEQVELKPSQLVPHKKNIRGDLGDLTSLVDSIKAKGVLQPLVVIPNGQPDKYIILAGHRRHAAAKKAGAKAVPTVPCIIRHDLVDEADQIAAMIAENTERTDLTAMEEARGVQELLDLGDNMKRIVERTGMSMSKVRVRAKVAKIPVPIAAKMSKVDITLDDAAFIADHLDDDEARTALENALGTNNWEVVKTRVAREAAQRKRVAKIRKDAAALGLDVIENYPDRYARTRLGRPTRYEQLDFPTDASWVAGDDVADQFVFIDHYNRFSAHLIVVYLVDPEPQADTERDSTEQSATTPPPPVEREPSPEEIARRARFDDFNTATAVRRKFIAQLIATGDTDIAVAAAELTTAIEHHEIAQASWGELDEYLPLSRPLPDEREVGGREAAAAEWVRSQRGTSTLLMAMAWGNLHTHDHDLSRPNINLTSYTAEDLAALQAYVDLLREAGHVFSDVEEERAAEIAEALDDADQDPPEDD